MWRLLQHEYFPREPLLVAAGLGKVHRLVDVTVKERRRNFHLLHGNVLAFTERQEDPEHSLLYHRRPHLDIVAHIRQRVATDDVPTIVLGHRTIRPALALASITAWVSFFSCGTYHSSHAAFVHRELTSALMTASNRSQSGAILSWSIRILSGLPRHFAANADAVTATPPDWKAAGDPRRQPRRCHLGRRIQGLACRFLSYMTVL